MDVKYSGDTIQILYCLYIEVYIDIAHQKSLQTLTLFLLSKRVLWVGIPVCYLFSSCMETTLVVNKDGQDMDFKFIYDFPFI